MRRERGARTSGLAIAALVAFVGAAFAGTEGAAFATPGARGPAGVMAVLAEMAQGMTATRYQHRTVVRQRRGEYFFDCSGMAAWVLSRAAPAAMRAVSRPDGARPVAATFHQAIDRVEPGTTRGAWQRVEHAASARPGDVLAWRRPPWFPSRSTGHVAFIVSEPVPSPGPVPGVLLRIADATRYPHEDDSRAEGETGFGTGVILVATDDAGRPAGYGWYGSASQPDWVVPCEMVIGRPLR